MRTCLLSLLIVALCAGNLAAQGPPPGQGLEGAFTVHGARREDSSKTWPGGGVGAAWNGGRLAIAGEATITRRDGHNDWHALAGPRVALVTTSRTRMFLQVMAGTIIRQKEARVSGQAGAGIDVSLSPRSSLRLLVAGLRDQVPGGALSSGRVTLGLVVR